MTWRDELYVGEDDSQSSLSTFQRKPKEQTFRVIFSMCEKNFRMFELADNHLTDE